MEKRLEIEITDLNDLPEACNKLFKFAGNIKIFAFFAPMGSGKTTFIKQLALFLGSSDSFSSPTYSVVNEYDYSAGKIYHFDFYRIKSQKEALDLGIDEYFNSGNYCFIEWPELVVDFFNKSYLRIIIQATENNRYLHAEIIN